MPLDHSEYAKLYHELYSSKKKGELLDKRYDWSDATAEKIGEPASLNLFQPARMKDEDSMSEKKSGSSAVKKEVVVTKTGRHLSQG